MDGGDLILGRYTWASLWTLIPGQTPDTTSFSLLCSLSEPRAFPICVEASWLQAALLITAHLPVRLHGRPQEMPSEGRVDHISPLPKSSLQCEPLSLEFQNFSLFTLTERVFCRAPMPPLPHTLLVTTVLMSHAFVSDREFPLQDSCPRDRFTEMVLPEASALVSFQLLRVLLRDQKITRL